MKVMHVIDSAGIYGAEVMLLNLMEEHAKMGLDPLLFSIESSDKPGDTSLSEEAQIRELTTIRQKSAGGFSLRMGLSIMRIAEEHGISLIHSHGYKGDILLGGLPRFMRKIPLISTVHGFTAIRRFTKIWFYLLLHKLFLRRMDAVVNVNSTMKISTGGAERFTIENGIPPLQFFDRDCIARADYAISKFCKEGVIIGTISRLSPEKGVGHLIEAVGSLVARGANVKAVIIGEGSQKEHLQKLILRSDLSERVLLVGYRNNAFNYLPLFDVFVLPSLTEGFPIAILEAMQAGVPIVATNVGGVPDLLGKGVYGVIVEPSRPEALAEAIWRFSSDPDSARKMAGGAKRIALSEYTSRRMAEKYLKVYETVLTKWNR